jgi:hypothetical protein
MDTIFDYQLIADKFDIPDNIVREIVMEIKEEIPNDNMIMELHIIRALKSYVKKQKFAVA